MSADRARQIARAQSLLGLLPLAVFVVLHVARAFSAFGGRAPWIASMVDGAPGAGVALALVLALVLHGALGVWRWRGRAELGAAVEARGLARVQLVTGVIVVAFVAYHVWQLWPEAAGPHVDRGRSYDLLHDSLGSWPHLVAYVVGITALAFHLGHGISRVPFSWGAAPSRGGVLRARLVGGVLGLALWLAALHVVGYFATGDGLWPRAGGAAPSSLD
jgi:succinate dehydrogenase / fumarate reductase cytochrome b subunit